MSVIADAVMEERCRSLVERLELPQPFSLQALADVVADVRGRPITLQPLPSDIGPGVSGIVMSTTSGYVISYPDHEASWWARMCVSHELAHILCHHLPEAGQASTASSTDTAPSTDTTPGTATETATDTVTRTSTITGPLQPLAAADVDDVLLPDMQEAIRAWGRLYRCDMHGKLEREAELTATLLVQRIERTAPMTAGTSSPRRDEAVLGRFATVLGSRRDRRR